MTDRTGSWLRTYTIMPGPRGRTVLVHVALPALGTAAIVTLYFTPVTVIGCATRGLLAFGVALVSLLVGLGCALAAVRHARVDRRRTAWWILSALVLTLPALLLLGPLG